VWFPDASGERQKLGEVPDKSIEARKDALSRNGLGATKTFWSRVATLWNGTAATRRRPTKRRSWTTTTKKAAN
jgi:hypothetical protein